MKTLMRRSVGATRRGRVGPSRAIARAGQEDGAVAIIVALLMVALLTLVALVVDLGSLYDHDRELQTAADAGALAGAQELFYSGGNTTQAEGATREYVGANSAPNSSVDGDNVSYDLLNIDARSVEVKLRETGVQFSFAPVIGKTEGAVTAYAKAELMYLTGIEGLFPVALPYVHPDHFRIVYGDGAESYDLRNEASGTASDEGFYVGSPEARSFGLGAGLHNVTVIAQDAKDRDLLTWSNIGSVYVPGSASAIQGVDVDRDIGIPGITGELSEYVTIEIHTTGVTDKDVEVQIEVANKSFKLRLDETAEGSGVYRGSASLGTPSFRDGVAEVSITTIGKNNSEFPDGVTVARYTWFQRGEPLVYVSWDGRSAPGSVTLSAVVRTKVLKFDSPIMIKPKFHDEGDYNGNDFWANVIVQQNLRTELEVALGMQPMGSDWELEPDVGEEADDPDTLGNGYADIGEYLPYDNGVSAGHWSWIDGVAEGKLVYMPIVDPAANNSKEWRIQAFAAFEITDVQSDGNRIAIIGAFKEWLEAGVWGSEKPPTGLYVETAVLTK